MPTFHNQFLSEVLSDAQIPAGTLAYFRARLRETFHELVLLEFVRRRDAGELTKADLARRIGRRPEQITRWLRASSNWTLDTVSDLLLAMAAAPKVNIEHLDDRQTPVDGRPGLSTPHEGSHILTVWRRDTTSTLPVQVVTGHDSTWRDEVSGRDVMRGYGGSEYMNVQDNETTIQSPYEG